VQPFQRSNLRLELDQVLEPTSPGQRFFAGHSASGQRYVILQTSGDDRAGTWTCAPITERALDFVVTGSAELRDAISHTATGTVDIITVAADGRCTESVRLCSELREEDLPPRGYRSSAPPSP
jgi:hypothetical protein